jgi:hypothetical protein
MGFFSDTPYSRFAGTARSAKPALPRRRCPVDWFRQCGIEDAAGGCSPQRLAPPVSGVSLGKNKGLGDSS